LGGLELRGFARALMHAGVAFAGNPFMRLAPSKISHKPELNWRVENRKQRNARSPFFSLLFISYFIWQFLLISFPS
jgi:hypothetical protein